MASAINNSNLINVFLRDFFFSLHEVFTCKATATLLGVWVAHTHIHKNTRIIQIVWVQWGKLLEWHWQQWIMLLGIAHVSNGTSIVLCFYCCLILTATTKCEQRSAFYDVRNGCANIFIYTRVALKSRLISLMNFWWFIFTLHNSFQIGNQQKMRAITLSSA